MRDSRGSLWISEITIRHLILPTNVVYYDLCSPIGYGASDDLDMPPRKPRAKKKREPTADVHSSASRAIVPTSEMSEQEPSLLEKERVYLDPERKEAIKERVASGFFLQWHRADDLDELPIWVKTIFTHEKIAPKALIESVRARAESVDKQTELFGANFNGIDPKDRWNFWIHESNWQNRLIHGNSIEVMASLLEREKREGQVQCMFFDPPYGINFQGIVAKQKGGGRDGEGVRAFSDNYIRKNKDGTITKGVAPFFDGIYRHVRLARRLLAETGSIFLQISEVNVNRVAIIMDEVFGPENRIAMINYTTARKEKTYIGSSGDYILWYTKNKEKATSKYYQLYEPRTIQEYIEQTNAVIVSNNGTTIEAISNIDALPNHQNYQLGKMQHLASQELGKKFQSEPWPTIEAGSKYHKLGQGKWKPMEDRHWSINNPVGIDMLVDRGRLWCSMGEGKGYENVKHIFNQGRISEVPEESTLYWVTYMNEDPGKKIDDIWRGGTVQGKWFTVETPERIIERCILMTTEPGDLVFDPTCGSGVTAVVAEKWGRRWITSDAGSWQVALCRERIITRTFDEYLLRGSEEGRKIDIQLDKEFNTNLAEKSPGKGNFQDRDPKQGFVYARRPRITAGTLSRGARYSTIPLVDQPEKVPGGENRRLASAFTVERLSPYDILNSEQVLQRMQDENLSRRIVETLNGKELSGNKLRNIVAIDEKKLQYLTHEGKLAGKKVAIWLAEDDLTVGNFHLNAAIKEALDRNFKQLVVVAFGFADENISSHYKKGTVDCWLLLAPRALSIEDTDAKSTGSPVLLAEPDIQVNKEEDEKISISVKGYITWDPVRKESAVIGSAEDDVNCILIDTDYDNESFFARLLQFPNSAKPNRDSKHIQSYREQLEDVMDDTLWNNITSTTSVPFDIPKKNGVAVRITTVSGDMMSAVISREEILQKIKNNEDPDTSKACSKKQQS